MGKIPYLMHKPDPADSENPVYCGKIAYGCRADGKVRGTEMKSCWVNRTITCWLDGVHEPIVSGRSLAGGAGKTLAQ